MACEKTHRFCPFFPTAKAAGVAVGSVDRGRQTRASRAGCDPVGGARRFAFDRPRRLAGPATFCCNVSIYQK
jgi:hypothetical protein